MPAAVEIVKLIGMKTQRAIGCKMKSDDPYHCRSIKEREGKTGTMFVDDRSPDVGHLGRLLPATSNSACYRRPCPMGRSFRLHRPAYPCSDLACGRVVHGGQVTGRSP